VTNKLGKVERTKLFDNDLNVSYKDETLDVTHDVEDYFNLKNDSEKKVIKLKVDGYNNSYIAKQLNMHPNKVASVINKVAERYKANNE
jgi:DNA-binding NarL/FixJ family response regulator